MSRATSLPLDGSSSGTTVFPEGSTAARTEGVWTLYNIVGDAYHQALSTPVVEGRGFEDVDRVRDVEPLVINRALAERLWPGQSPVGKRLRVGDPHDGALAEVVGLTGTARYQKISEAPQPFMSRSLLRHPVPRSTVVIRTSAAPEPLYPQIRRIVSGADETMPITGLKTLRDHISVSYSAHQGGAFGAASFGALALLLAAAGLYGVISYGVAQRRREIGVRVALGADPGALIRMVVRSGARLAAIGIGVGVLLSLAVGSALESMLFQTSPRDPLLIVTVGVVLAIIAVLASLIPAWRLVRSNPVLALRE